MSYIQKTCACCGKTFSASLKEHNRGNAKYCSKTCCYASLRKPSEQPKICPRCGVEHTKEGVYCSRSCSSKRPSSDSKKQKLSEKAKNNLVGFCSPNFEKPHAAVFHAYESNPKTCTVCGNKLTYEKRNNKACSTECRNVIFRKNAQDRGFGGKRNSKTIYHNGVCLDSTYELKVALELDLHGIKWTRPKSIPWIDSNGINRQYFPDFYLEDHDVYLDPKNDYLIKIDTAKIEAVSIQNDVRIIVLNKKQLTWNAIKSFI